MNPQPGSPARPAGPAAVAAAALAAVGHSAFEGRADPIVRARRVAASLGRSLGWDTATVARLIGTSRRSARRLATEPLDPRLEKAVRLQVALRDACAGQAKVGRKPQSVGRGR